MRAARSNRSERPMRQLLSVGDCPKVSNCDKCTATVETISIILFVWVTVWIMTRIFKKS